jgi:hypothetical protein
MWMSDGWSQGNIDQTQDHAENDQQAQNVKDLLVAAHLPAI